MAESKSSTDEHVSCEVCLREIPVSEATTPEAVDYVMYFCGIECYAKWRQQDERGDDGGKTP